MDSLPPSVRRLYAWKKPPATRRNSHNAGRLLTFWRVAPNKINALTWEDVAGSEMPWSPIGVLGSVTIVDRGSGGSAWPDSELLEARRRESRVLRRISQETRARARVTRHWVRVSQTQREALGYSPFARLQARMETLSVIEQAKGIVMADQLCGPDEAFDLLRRMSQRANVKVHVLAAQIVEHVASSNSYDNVTPISIRTYG